MKNLSKKNLEMKTNSTKAIRYVLVTDARYEYLMKIFSRKCMGEVSFYTDEDNNNRVEGEFIAASNKYKNYAWKWAHKIYYSFDRLTCSVGNNVVGGYFENKYSEYMYIFENLSTSDLELIERIVQEHHLFFKFDHSDLDFLENMATATHNYYSAWEKVGMKYHPFCSDLDLYLKSAKEHLLYLSEFMQDRMGDSFLKDSLTDAIKNIEDFMSDKVIRDHLLKLHESRFALDEEVMICV